MPESLAFATNFFIYASWAGSFIFIAGYTYAAPWWRSNAGRVVFSLGGIVFAISTLGVLSQLFGQDYGARPWIRFLIWGATAAVTLGLCVMLWREQGRRKK